jgi:hypothetical protein
VNRLRIAHLRLLIPFVVIAWRAALPIGDNSFLWHVRAGTLQLETGEVLRSDPFSFTAGGEPWRTQSWLLELGYGWLENLTGSIGWVPVMKFVAMSLTIALLGLVIHRVGNGRPWLTLGGMLLLVWQSTPFGVARPALLGYLLLAIVVVVAHTRPTPLWILPPLFWLWATIHGMFAIGLAYLFLDGLGKRSRRQLVAVAVSGLATAFTAHGLGTWWVLVQFLRNRGALDLISEWQPPDFSNPFVVPMLVVVLGIIVAGARERLQPSQLWIVVPFVAFGVLAERNLWPAVMVLTPVAILGFGGVRLERPVATEAAVLNWAIAAALVVVGVIGLTRPLSLREDRFPSQEVMSAVAEGPLFHGTAVGGYLIYADWPERLVYIDDRAELFGEAGFRQFHELRAGVDVEATFAELEIEQALVSVDWPIVGYLDLLGWTRTFEDENFVVMAAP